MIGRVKRELGIGGKEEGGRKLYVVIEERGAIDECNRSGYIFIPVTRTVSALDRMIFSGVMNYDWDGLRAYVILGKE